jgi:hypothetical protein
MLIRFAMQNSFFQELYRTKPPLFNMVDFQPPASGTFSPPDDNYTTSSRSIRKEQASRRYKEVKNTAKMAVAQLKSMPTQAWVMAPDHRLFCEQMLPPD